MGRPDTKQALIEAANAQFTKLWAFIDAMPENAKAAPFRFDESAGKEAHWQRDKNLRDVYIHLHEWHKLLLDCVSANRRGEAKPFLPEPYNWKNYGEMNVMFWARHQATACEDAKALLLGSHKQVLQMVEKFTDEELFEKKRYAWAGSSSVGSYCVSATSSHYEWAMKKIKAHIKLCK